MTIEQKAQRYDGAIERAKSKIKNDKDHVLYEDDIIEIFPELKESENERIRKRIIQALHGDILEMSELTDCITWLKKQNEIDSVSYQIAEKEKGEFVGDGFIKCYAGFQDFKEGETYWLEYIGNDNYNVRSDNLLGKTYHITPCQLYTIFKKQTWLEKQGERPKKVSIWKHWSGNGIAGNGEGKNIYLIKRGMIYEVSSCLAFECDYIELSELDQLMQEEKQGEQSNANKEYWRGYREGKQEVLDKYSELKKQGEQKPAVIFPKFRVGDEIKTANEESLIITKIDEKGYWSEDLFICCFEDADKWKLVEQKVAIATMNKEPVSNDLAEAADKHVENWYKEHETEMKDYPIDVKISKEDFIAGARWQKRQIMKDAVEVEVGNETINSDEFAQGVLRGAATNLITWIDYNAAEGNMCLSNMECEDLEDAVVDLDWSRVYDYMKKKLEKQGNKPQGKSALEAAKEEKVDNRNCKKPKFHDGDWVILSLAGEKDKLVQIQTIEYFPSGQPRYVTTEGKWYGIGVNSRLWTIQDAKDGDVLCYKDEISLYKHDIKNCTKQGTTFGGFVYHCCYDGKRFVVDSLYSLTEQDKMNIHPATKEQRDQLEKAMADAGYAFDFEKKELKKIEQKPKFKVGDTMRTLQEANDGYTDGMPVVVSIDEEYYHCNNELIAIKDQDDYEYPPMNRRQKPAKWGEEDESKIKLLIAFLDTNPNSVIYLRPKEEWIDWLKSLKNRVQHKPMFNEKMDIEVWKSTNGQYVLKVNGNVIRGQLYDDAKLIYKHFFYLSEIKSLRPQNRWKPSDEQIDALNSVCGEDSISEDDRDMLIGLYTDLKKLREE